MRNRSDVLQGWGRGFLRGDREEAPGGVGCGEAVSSSGIHGMEMEINADCGGRQVRVESTVERKCCAPFFVGHDVDLVSRATVRGWRLASWSVLGFEMALERWGFLGGFGYIREHDGDTVWEEHYSGKALY